MSAGEGARACPDRRAWLRWALALLYVGIGAVHLVRADLLMPIMPAWVPEPRLVILVTGLCEIAGALALLGRRLRNAGAVGLALYAACVYPANLKHALEHVPVPGIPDSWWYHGPRLAFQPVLIWAALYAGGAIDWPFRQTSKDASATSRNRIARSPR